MSNPPEPDTQQAESQNMRRTAVVIGIAVALLIVTIIAAVILLAVNADKTGPHVEVIRDLLVIIMALELIVIGAAITVLVIQVARFINLLSNELQPLIDATSDTVNTVKGTAVFLSKNLADPVVNAQATLRGLGKVAKDVDAINRAVSIFSAAASAASPTGARSTPQPETGTTNHVKESTAERQKSNKTPPANAKTDKS